MLFIQEVCSTGYEKPTYFSGKYTGISGAAISHVEGAESLVFNPAGIAHHQNKKEIVFNLTTTSTILHNPYLENKRIKEEFGIDTPFSLFGLIPYDEKSAFSFGIYSFAGNKSNFKHFDYSSISPQFAHEKPDSNNYFGDIEMAIGYGRKILSGLTIGGAVRVSLFSGEFQQNGIIQYVKPGSSQAQEIDSTHAANLGYTTNLYGNGLYGLSHLEFNKLKGIHLGAIRLGVQYEPHPLSYGFGMSFRSSVSYKMKGKISGNLATSDIAGINSYALYALNVANGGGSSITSLPAGSAATTARGDITGGDVTLEGKIPWQANLGGHYYLNDNFLLSILYSFTNYQDLKKLEVEGSMNSTSNVMGTILTSNATPLSSLELDWKNLHSMAIGLDYQNKNKFHYRLGMTVASQVIGPLMASTTSMPPGPGYGITFGIGKDNFFKNTNLNVTFEAAAIRGELKENDNNKIGPLDPITQEKADNFKGLTGKFSFYAYNILFGIQHYF